jgi:hypothetical protein
MRDNKESVEAESEFELFICLLDFELLPHAAMIMAVIKKQIDDLKNFIAGLIGT